MGKPFSTFFKYRNLSLLSPGVNYLRKEFQEGLSCKRTGLNPGVL